MQITEMFHYLCSFCNHIWEDDRVIDRTTEVRCPGCKEATIRSLLPRIYR